MKYKIFMLLLVFSCASQAQQIPNGGFETWSNPKHPDSWFTYSSISNLIDLAHKDTSNKVEGAASAKIETTSLSGSTIYEILSLGTADQSSIFSGGIYTYHPIYFHFKPDTLFFSYKYSTPGIDTASIYIKFKTITDSLLGLRLPLYARSQWADTFILLTPLYLTANTPDSLLIQFQSSIASPGQFGTSGSVLNVDALRFGYLDHPAAIQELVAEDKISIFPNPADLFIHADCPNGYQIFSATGALMKQSDLPASKILVEDLPSGLYILKSDGKTARFVKGY